MPKLPLIRIDERNSFAVIPKRSTKTPISTFTADHARFSEPASSAEFLERRREAERFMDAFGFEVGVSLLRRGLTFEEASRECPRVG